MLHSNGLTDSYPARSETIGLIGVGLMGHAIARRLVSANFSIVGWDKDPGRLELLEKLGGRAAAGADAVLRETPRVILSLPDLEVVSDVLRQSRSQLRAGQIILDTTTGDPLQSEALGCWVQESGPGYLDATVLGSSAQISRGEVVFMVGGSEAVARQCQDVFSALGKQWFHTGVSGSGARMKLVTNLVLGLNRAALAEGLAFTKALGLNQDQALAVLRAGVAHSRVMDTKGEKMVNSEFEPQARLSQHLKDVRLILNAAPELKLPLSEAHRRLLETVVASGGGGLDNSAIIRAYEAFDINGNGVHSPKPVAR